MPEINQILAECDVKELMAQLCEFDIRLTSHIPSSILFTQTGELNLRNQYGAILFHTRSLRSILHNFTTELGVG